MSLGLECFDIRFRWSGSESTGTHGIAADPRDDGAIRCFGLSGFVRTFS